MFAKQLILLILVALLPFTSWGQNLPIKTSGKPSAAIAVNSAETNLVSSEFITIDPNPFINVINIQMLETGTGTINIEILSIVGKAVRQYKLPTQESFSLNLSDLEKGVYLMKINNGKSSCVKRIFHQ